MGFWDIVTTGLGLSEVKEQAPRKVKIEQSEPESIFGDKICIQRPITFTDITKLVKTLRKNDPLIVNFLSLEPSVAERSLDFVCGAVCALGGSLERIGEGIYFYAPVGLKVEADKRYKRT